MEYLVFIESGGFGIIGCINAENEHEAKDTLAVRESIGRIECLTGRLAEIIGIEQRDETMELLEQAKLFWFIWCSPRCKTMNMIAPELMA